MARCVTEQKSAARRFFYGRITPALNVLTLDQAE